MDIYLLSNFKSWHNVLRRILVWTCKRFSSVYWRDIPSVINKPADMNLIRYHSSGRCIEACWIVPRAMQKECLILFLFLFFVFHLHGHVIMLWASFSSITWSIDPDKRHSVTRRWGPISLAKVFSPINQHGTYSLVPDMTRSNQGQYNTR